MPNRPVKMLITVLAFLLLWLAQQRVLDTIGQEYTEAGFTRALITFGVARALNGVISVAQGTEVAVEPVGIGLTFTPGQILDPINDLIERFSWVVLASSTSLGIQRVLLDITSWPGFTALVCVLVLAALLVLWWQRPLPSWLRRGLLRAALVLLVLRFAIPLVAIVNEGLYHFFLAPLYTESQQQLENTARVIGEINAGEETGGPAPQQRSFLESARSMLQTAADRVRIEARIEDFKQSVEQVSEHAINLIVVFVLQTLLFPLLFLWLIVQMIKRLLV